MDVCVDVSPTLGPYAYRPLCVALLALGCGGCSVFVVMETPTHEHWLWLMLSSLSRCVWGGVRWLP